MNCAPARTLGLVLSLTVSTSALAAPPEQPAGDAQATPPAPVEPAPAPVYQPPPEPVYQPPAPAPNPNRGRGMAIGGWAAFSGVYLINVTIAATAEQGSNAKWLYIPVAGPFATISQLRFVERDPDAIIDGSGISNTLIGVTGFFLAVDGLAQLATLGLAIAGTTIFAKSRADARWSLSPGGLRYKF